MPRAAKGLNHMKRELASRIADAVLYEGYLLYPYRPSVKNRQRWTFGGLYPPAYCQAHQNGEAYSLQTECLVAGSRHSAIKVSVRFLQIQARRLAPAAQAGEPNW